MKYDESLVDQIRQQIDIVDLVSEYLPLKKAGRNFKALSPFTEEKTPSFMVSPEKQIFHCFSTGQGGDVFGFLMKYENLSFPEAIRRLAEKANISLPEEKSYKKTTDEKTEKEKYYEMYELAAGFYAKYFEHESHGKKARDYWDKRKFKFEITKEFQVGWAPDAWQALFEYLRKKGYSEDLLIKARLVNRSEKGRCYDVFKNRLMFPIHNLQGKVVAFGGRQIEDGDGPKYLNSPENPIFIKRRELFGLHLAKRYLDRELPQIFIVEGYLDFFRLYEQGFKTAAATLGTALTEEHVQLLKRFVQEVIVIYDGDQAGIAASLRGLEVFLAGGLNVKLVSLPEGNDPDDFLLREGPESFKKLVSNAKDFFDYKLNILLSRYSVSDASGIVKISEDALETLEKVKNPVLQDRYLRKLSALLGVNEASLKTQLQNRSKKLSSSVSRESATQQPSIKKKAVQAGGLSEEILVLGLVIDHPEFLDDFFSRVSVDNFILEDSKKVFQYLQKIENGKPIVWAKVLELLNDGPFKESFMQVSMMEWNEDEEEKAFRDCLSVLDKKNLQRQLDDLRKQIGAAERMGNLEKVLELTQSYQT